MTPVFEHPTTSLRFHILPVALLAAVAFGCGGETDAARPTGLVFTSPPESLVRGLRVELEVRERWSDGSARAVTSPLTWSSSHPGIVSVSEGRVRGLAPGDAIVTASSAAFTASLPLHVHRERVVFVTSSKGTGDLGSWPTAGGEVGLAAADASCAAHAAEAGLFGTYRAWLSGDEDDAYCRSHGLAGRRADRCGLPALPASAGPWVRTDGRPFADGISALMAGAVLYPPHLNEHGRSERVIRLGTTVPDTFYPTATGPDGARSIEFGAQSCGNWTDAGPTATAPAGDGSSGTEAWTLAAEYACAGEARLLCLEVGDGPGPALEPYAATGKLAFVTSEMGPGDLGSWPEAGSATGLDAADAICANLAAAAGRTGTFRAWIGGASVAVARIVDVGPWVRPDGVVVADSELELVQSELRAPISVDEWGRPVSWGVWVGGSTRLDGPADCRGWTTLQDLGTGGSSSSSGPYWATFETAYACGSSFRLYCLEQ